MSGNVPSFRRRFERFRYRLRGWWLGRHKRCDHCGRRKHWDDAWHAYPSGDRVWHSECMAYINWRSKATERIEILDLICEVWGVTMQDVTSIASGRAAQGDDDGPELASTASSNAWDKAWRVMHDRDNHRKAAPGVRI